MKRQINNTTDEFISGLMDQVKGSIESCHELSEEKIWTKQGAVVWRADRFVGLPVFYPVYRYENYYSYSLLALLLLKGTLRLNRSFIRGIPGTRCPYYSGLETIDLEINRIGTPPTPGFVITDADEFARLFAEAMRKDTAAVETANPGFTNVVMCGGKDSLNLLLLPWKNPVVVASGSPNYDLVRKFIQDNNLEFDVVKLNDMDDSLLDVEIMINCCRNNLEHFRWGADLKRLSNQLDGNAIFWKGQLGGVFVATDWKEYGDPPHTEPEIISQTFKILKNHGKYRFYSFLHKTRLTQRICFKRLWTRGAMWQGVHMSYIRQLTDALALSGYHGPSVQKILSQVDLYKAVQEDVRPLVGKHLHGGPVSYPVTNPGPPPSVIRKGISHLAPFLKTLSATPIRIQSE